MQRRGPQAALESATFSLGVYATDVLYKMGCEHRKAELAKERGGLTASIGQYITDPRFVHMDEVLRLPHSRLYVFPAYIRSLGGLIGKKGTP